MSYVIKLWKILKKLFLELRKSSIFALKIT